MWACRDLTLVVGPDPPSSSSSPSDEPAPLGTLQLDPDLHHVRVCFPSPTSVGKIIVAPLLTEDENGQRSFGFSHLSFQAGDDEPFVLFDGEGRFRDPQAPDDVRSPRDAEPALPRQLVLSHTDGRWRTDGLARGEKDYPVLA